jgi:FkbM family methyltransferase
MAAQVETRWMTAEDARRKQASYAQNFEDVRLRRVFPQATGFYIDVGANHPVFHSVTKAFSDRGWRGINIEPHPGLLGLYHAERPRDINLNVGVSDAEGVLTFYEAPGYLHGWCTFHPEAAESYRRKGVEVVESSVPVRTLAQICEEHAPAVIDFLKIDAECYEPQVVRGADWGRWRPRVVVIEAGIPELVAEWEPLIEAADYLLATFDGLNRYYVPREERELIPELAASIGALDQSISYECLRFVDECERLSHALQEAARQLDEIHSLGPTALGIARRIKGLADGHPRLCSIARRLLGRAG